MTKTQGWIIVAILAVALIAGLAAYGAYIKHENNISNQETAGCMNTCSVPPNSDMGDNTCLTQCLQQDGLPNDFPKTP